MRAWHDMNYWGKMCDIYTSIYYHNILYIYIVYEGWAHSSQVNSPFRTSFANLFFPSRKGSCFYQKIRMAWQIFSPIFHNSFFSGPPRFIFWMSNLKNDDFEVRDFPFKKMQHLGDCPAFLFFFLGGGVGIDKNSNLKYNGLMSAKDSMRPWHPSFFLNSKTQKLGVFFSRNAKKDHRKETHRIQTNPGPWDAQKNDAFFLADDPHVGFSWGELKIAPMIQPKNTTYSWWFRNPANSPVEVGSLSVYPIIGRVLYIPGDAGYLPSTVTPEIKHIRSSIYTK